MSLRSATALALLLAGAASAYYPTNTQHYSSYGSTSNYNGQQDQWAHHDSHQQEWEQPHHQQQQQQQWEQPHQQNQWEQPHQQQQQQWKYAEYEDAGHLASHDSHSSPVQGSVRYQSGAPFPAVGKFQTPIDTKYADVCPGLTLPLRTQSFDPAAYLAGKSPYSVPTVEAVRTATRGCPGCKLRHVHLLARHGSRFPSSDERDTFDKLQQFVANAQPPNAKYAWIPKWHNPITPTMAENLHPRGWKDLRDLAMRDQMRYKPYLTKEEFQSYPEHFEARSTYVPRVLDSGTAYLQQIFGKDSGPKLRSVPKQKADKLLRPWDACPAYKPSIDAPAVKEAKKKREAAVVQRITQRLSQQVLGKPFNGEAETKLLWTMYTSCMMGRALCREDSGQWCNVFTESELQQLNLFKDINYWFEDGPGLPLNTQMTGPMIRTIVGDLKRVATEDDSLTSRPQFKLWFGHSETIMRLYNGLNVLQKPEAQAPNAFNQNRHLPFAANVHLELWQNPEPETQDKYAGFFVRLLVNERPVVMPQCMSSGLFYPLATFIKATKAVAKNSLDAVCKRNEW